MNNQTAFLLIRDNPKSISQALFTLRCFQIDTKRLGKAISKETDIAAVAVKMAFNNRHSRRIRRVLRECNITPILNIKKKHIFIDRVLVTGDECELCSDLFIELEKEVRYGAA